jgi:hypothetical protein
VISKSGPVSAAHHVRGEVFAQDGQPIEADDVVLIRAKVTGAAGPLHDLPEQDTGVVAIELDGYLDATLKGCVKPSIVEAVVKKAVKPDPGPEPA